MTKKERELSKPITHIQNIYIESSASTWMSENLGPHETMGWNKRKILCQTIHSARCSSLVLRQIGIIYPHLSGARIKVGKSAATGQIIKSNTDNNIPLTHASTFALRLQCSSPSHNYRVECRSLQEIKMTSMFVSMGETPCFSYPAKRAPPRS